MHLVSFRLTAAYADLWILWPLSLKSPYLGLEAIFFRSRKFCCFFEHRRNFWELFSHLAAKLGVLLGVRVEAISESLDLAVKSGGRETKKARGAPTTSQYRRKMKLGEMKDWAKSRRKTVRYRSPTTRTQISWTLLYIPLIVARLCSKVLLNFRATSCFPRQGTSKVRRWR